MQKEKKMIDSTNDFLYKELDLSVLLLLSICECESHDEEMKPTTLFSTG